MPEKLIPPKDRRRVARLCLECLTRKFGEPDWVCESHPHRTVTQANRPYFGGSTEGGPREKPADA